MRNYYNQAVHDILNREEAFEVLELFSGEVDNIPNEDFESISEQKIKSTNITEDMIKISSLVPCKYNNWNELSIKFPDQYQKQFDDFDHYHIPLPTGVYYKLKIQEVGYEANVFLLWESHKIMLFEDEEDIIQIQGWKALKVSEVRADTFKNYF